MRREQVSFGAVLACILASAATSCSEAESNGNVGGPSSSVTTVAPTTTEANSGTQPTVASSSNTSSSATVSTATNGAPSSVGTTPTTATTSTSTLTSSLPPSSSSSGAEPNGSGPVDSSGGAESSIASHPSAPPPEDTSDESGGQTSEPDPGETFGPDIDEACRTSERANANASGSGPYDVVVETNSGAGISEGTIFRPAELGGDELFPVFVWGEGGCSRDGLSNAAAMAEIASHGYFVIADGTPNGSGSREMNANDVASMGRPLIAYIDWALKENVKPCSAYYHNIDASKISANGFSCGGLMSMGTAADPRLTTWGQNSSGLFGVNQPFYDSVHTPVLVIVGNDTDQANPNGRRDYDNLSAAGVPILFFEDKTAGHGGDLFQPGGGDFTKINLAWINWWLKGDEGATGKGLLVGAGCPYCTDNNWTVMSANLP